MSDLVFSTYNDLYAARSIGRLLVEPTVHFVRVMRLFPPEGRLALLKDAYAFSKQFYQTDFSLEQFVAFALFAWDPHWPVENAISAETPSEVQLDRLTREQKYLVRIAASAQSEGLVAEVLTRTSANDARSTESEVLRVIAESLGGRIEDAALAAAVAQCLLFNRRLIRSYQDETAELVGFAASIPEDEFDTHGTYKRAPLDSLFHDELPDLSDIEFDRAEFESLTRDVSSLVEAESLLFAGEFNRELSDDLALGDKFGFVESPSGLFVPSHARKMISTQFADLINRASEDKAHLLTLSPRGFEEFMASLFQRLGYDVELTKSTRDGGVDLICLHSVHGIPFRLAVEVKRYKEDRPITVEMVRSFVGANKQFEADKLVYVTTSSYTAPAMSFADNYASQLLHLKDYEQIKEWCTEAQTQSWLLLPNSGTRR
jgi:hypothetical protein